MNNIKNAMLIIPLFAKQIIIRILCDDSVEPIIEGEN